tara:strand:+ start:3283 stop:4602 length:1320 start_codon:yes stop_codon:yes gene_type:complete
MIEIKKNILHKKNWGQIFFLLGTFFLASALPISILCYLISILFSILEKKESILKDKFNQALLVCSGIIIFSNINTAKLTFDLFRNEDHNVWLDLLNWLPLFLLFIFVQEYLKRDDQRLIFGQVLVSGTIPVLISCALQSWFKIYGPFGVLNDLIIWFQKEIPATDYGISGLFSNPNYTGVWLSSVFPFVVSEQLINSKNQKKNYFSQIALVIILIFFVYFTFLTASRNAFLGILITFIFVVRKKFKTIMFFGLLPFLSSSAFLILIQSALKTTNFISFLPLNLINKLLSLNIEKFSRIDIYQVGTNLIMERPLLGYGPSRFKYLYNTNGGIWQNTSHLHNLPLEIAFNYGIPLAVILTSLIVFLLIKSWQKIYSMRKFDNYFINNRTWLIASSISTVSHIYDVTYYDGKISIIIWIFLAGLKCIIEDDIKESNINQNNI